MTTDTIQRYQPGGDIYATIAKHYGESGANTIATAANTGDETQINAALVQVKNGGPLNESLLSILGSQLYNDPFAAPIEQANKIASNGFAAAFKNPAFLVTVLAIGGALFFLIGGAALFRKSK
ncbi:MAG: hypothetical protein PHY43_03885 [Verrucomicrobiales bacterium]|nr:hypothetical protein [Verrucomicrobiales bacterium]